MACRAWQSLETLRAERQIHCNGILLSKEHRDTQGKGRLRSRRGHMFAKEVMRSGPKRSEEPTSPSNRFLSYVVEGVVAEGLAATPLLSVE